MKGKFKQVAFSGGVSLGCLITTGALAQTSESPSSPLVTQSGTQASPLPQGTPATAAVGDTASPSANGPDEIIITANKRVENVQDVPKSVQVVSDIALQRQNVVNISDLQKLVPTVAGSGQTLAIRGVGTGASSIGSQSKVGIVLDDVPQPSRATLANNLQDIERLEVLPGPQGTLAGRNATGGLINLVTRGPTSDWRGFINVLGTSDQEKQAAAFVSGPVADKIQISMSQYYRGFRGLYKNIFLDQWANEITYGTRDKIKLLLTDDFTATGTVFYQYSKRNSVGGQGGGPGGGSPIIYGATPPANYYYVPDVRLPRTNFAAYEPGVTPGPDNNSYSSPLNGTSRTTTYGGIGRLEYSTPGRLNFTSITSYFSEKNPIRTDFCGCQMRIIDLNVRPEWDGFVNIENATKSFTQEMRVNSPSTGRLHYTAGVFYSYLKQTYNYNRWYQPVNWLRDFYTKSYSAYAHVDYDITDQLKIQGGVRYEKDRVYYNWTFLPILATAKAVTNPAYNSALPTSTTNNPYQTINFPTTNVLIVNKNSTSDDFINFDLGAQYRVTEAIMVYGTYAQAQQGPIFDAEDNITAIAAPLQPLPQEKVKNFEVGVKSQLFDRRLTLNVSAFQGTYLNYQVQTNIANPDPLLPPTLKVASVGKVRTRGVEVNASGRIGEHLRPTLNLAYTEAKILDFPNAPCFSGAVVGSAQCTAVNAGTAAAFNTQGNLNGKLLNRSPRLRFSFSFDYGIPIGENGLEAFIAPLIKYASAQRTDLLGLPSSFQSRSVFVDTNIGLRKKNFTAELFVRNLFKESIETYGITATGFTPNNVIVNRQLDRNNNRYFGGRFRYTF